MNSSIDIIKQSATKLYPKLIQFLTHKDSKTYSNNKWTLGQLHHWRQHELPDALKVRYEEEEQCYITPEELALLLEWKMAMGKFRPVLRGLIKRNSDSDVKTTTNEALSGFLKHMGEFEDDAKGDGSFWSKDRNIYRFGLVTSYALEKLCSLKGIGPATASLMLSCLIEITDLAPPFFCDEAFLYYVVDRLRPGSPIRYNMNEYCKEYLPLVLGIATMTHSNLTMNEVETGGYALKMISLHRDDILEGFDIPSEFSDVPDSHRDVADGMAKIKEEVTDEKRETKSEQKGQKELKELKELKQLKQQKKQPLNNNHSESPRKKQKI